MATNAQAVVHVIFVSGKEKDYLITAHKGIAFKLGEALGDTGCLSLWNDQESFGIPKEQIEEWSIRDLTAEEREAESGPRPEHLGSLPSFVTGAGRTPVSEAV